MEQPIMKPQELYYVAQFYREHNEDKDRRNIDLGKKMPRFKNKVLISSARIDARFSESLAIRLIENRILLEKHYPYEYVDFGKNKLDELETEEKHPDILVMSKKDGLKRVELKATQGKVPSATIKIKDCEADYLIWIHMDKLITKNVNSNNTIDITIFKGLNAKEILLNRENDKIKTGESINLTSLITRAEKQEVKADHNTFPAEFILDHKKEILKFRKI